MESPEVAPRPVWELTEEERRGLAETDLIDEGEYFVLFKINQGRRMLRLDITETYRFDSPELEPDIENVDECLYYDAIASLLFAAGQDGFDLRGLCEDALDQYQSFTNIALVRAAALRPAGGSS